MTAAEIADIIAMLTRTLRKQIASGSPAQAEHGDFVAEVHADPDGAFRWSVQVRADPLKVCRGRARSSEAAILTASLKIADLLEEQG